jgi:hypothetical protein
MISKESGWIEIQTALSNRLTAEKFKTIQKYFTFPLKVCSVTSDILQNLYYCFNGQNAAFDIESRNESINESLEYLTQDLQLRKWIEEHGKRVLKSECNSVVVLDIDEQGKPKLIYVENDDIEGYELNEDGTFKFIIFEHSESEDESEERYAFYDDEYYRVILKKGTTYKLETEVKHTVGYCPATFFYNNPLYCKDDFQRSVPLSIVTGALVEWQLFETFIYYAEHYSVFPIIEYPESGCNNTNCVDGIIQPVPILNDLNEVTSYTQPQECPTCAKKAFIGAGTAIGIEVSESAEIQDTRGIVRFIVPDITSLEFAEKKQAEKEQFIKINTVGYSKAIGSQAVNELQVRSLMESRRRAIIDVKEQFEKLYKWIVKTMGRVLYNVDVIVQANYGTEFFLLGESELIAMITEAKKAGLTSAEIGELHKMLISTKYKNDPEKAKKMLLFSELEPVPFDTIEEAKIKFLDGVLTKEDYFLKANFYNLIKRFERENGSITDFGEELEEAANVEKIQDTLYYYVNQKLEKDGKQNDTLQPI